MEPILLPGHRDGELFATSGVDLAIQIVNKCKTSLNILIAHLRFLHIKDCCYKFVTTIRVRRHLTPTLTFIHHAGITPSDHKKYL